MDNFIFIAGVSIALIVGVVIIMVILSRMYHRSTKETSFVRTGMGGQKVVLNGAAIVMPIVHEVININMKTLKQEVVRTGGDALITLDRNRIDVGATFYFRVKPDVNAIAQAAQTLGKSVNEPQELRAMVEDKFVDALRTVAATMNLADMHEKRSDFVAAVQNTVAKDLEMNGLELETVSLTKLDQTDIKFLNDRNTFDAEGLTNITRLTEQRRMERNEVEQSTRISIETRNQEAEKQSLAIAQATALAQQRAEQTRLADLAGIEARQATEVAGVSADRARREAAITAEQAIATAEAVKAIAVNNARQETEVAALVAERSRREAAIEAEQTIALAEQNKQIAINEASEAESVARSKADVARAEAVTASENVKTAEATAIAERNKRVTLIRASEEAEKEATKITVNAQAEFDAATLRTQARIKDAEALDKENQVKAAGELAMAAAANSLSNEQVQYRQRVELFKVLPAITESMASPMRAIKSARIISVPGIGPVAAGAAGVAGSTGANLPEQFTSAALNYRMMSPLVDKFTKEVGIDFNRGLADMIDPSIFSDNEDEDEAVTAEEIVSDDDRAIRDIKTRAGIISE